jgi:hypothetical protein
MMAKKQVCMQYISTHKMVTDHFTKAIPKDVFVGHVKYLGLRRLYFYILLNNILCIFLFMG